MSRQSSLSLSRRLILSVAGFLVLALAGTRRRNAHATDSEISQPEETNAAAFIARAFALRQRALEAGDQGYGALLVKGTRIVGESASRVVVDGDPTAHAEMAAIRDAARRLGRRDLSGCTLYSSSRPCPMCEAAAYWAGIDRLVYGRNGTDGGPPRLCG